MSAELFPWYEEPFWESVRERLERLREDEGEAVAWASLASILHSRQLLFALTPFWLVSVGRPPRGPDEWLPHRLPVESSVVAIEASAPLGCDELLERNRRIVARVLELIDARADGASEAARGMADARRARMLQRPARARTAVPDGDRPPWGDRSKALGHEPHRGLLDFHLQHPHDHDFRRALPGIDDPALLGLVREWIADVDRNYADLVASIRPDCADHADAQFDADAPTAVVAHTGIPSPARMRTPHGEEPVATSMLIVQEGAAPQPDGIRVMPGERWRIRGHRLEDGSVMPCWGTYRLSPGG